MGMVGFNLKDKNIVTEKKYLDKSGNTYNYVWTSNATTLPAHSSRTFTSTTKLYGISGMYYYVVKRATNTTFSTANENTYPNADVPNNSWTESNVNIASGSYKQFDKDSGITTSVISQYTVEIGDVLYANGAISKSYNSSLGTPVGLIFYTNPTTYDRNLGYTHGYAMSLLFANNDNTSVIWCSGTYATIVATDGLLTPRATSNGKADLGDIITTGLLQAGETEEQYRLRVMRNDMEGLKHCKTALSNDQSNMTAILKAMTHDTYTGIPKSSTSTMAGGVILKSPTTSGWYLPSTGQFYHWMKMCISEITGSEAWVPRNIANYYLENTSYVGSNYTRDFLIRRETYTNTAYTTTSKYFMYQIKQYHTNKGLTGLYNFLTFISDWTSTENYCNCAFGLNFDSNEVYFCDGRQGWADKGVTNHMVRPVIAF